MHCVCSMERRGPKDDTILIWKLRSLWRNLIDKTSRVSGLSRCVSQANQETLTSLSQLGFRASTVQFQLSIFCGVYLELPRSKCLGFGSRISERARPPTMSHTSVLSRFEPHEMTDLPHGQSCMPCKAYPVKWFHDGRKRHCHALR